MERPDLVAPYGAKRLDITNSQNVGPRAVVVVLSVLVPSDLELRIEGFGQGLVTGWDDVLWRIKSSGNIVSQFNDGNPLRDQISSLSRPAEIFIMIERGRLVEIEVENSGLVNSYLIGARLKGWFF